MFEYKMSKEMAAELLKNRKGDEKKKRKFYKHRGVRGKNSPSKQQKYKPHKKNQ